VLAATLPETPTEGRSTRLQEQIQNAIRTVAADEEYQLRELGRDHIRRGEAIPDWVLEDLHDVLVLQGELGAQSWS
jgi:hypothetical protein